jgi:hypothetical protein
MDDSIRDNRAFELFLLKPAGVFDHLSPASSHVNVGGHRFEPGEVFATITDKKDAFYIELQWDNLPKIKRRRIIGGWKVGEIRIMDSINEVVLKNIDTAIVITGIRASTYSTEKRKEAKG